MNRVPVFKWSIYKCVSCTVKTWKPPLNLCDSEPAEHSQAKGDLPAHMAAPGLDGWPREFEIQTTPSPGEGLSFGGEEASKAKTDAKRVLSSTDDVL